MFLMVWAKGLGLDSSDKAYYVLAAMAVCFWVFHMLHTRWPVRMFVFFVLAVGTALAAVIINRKLGVILSVMTMVAMKGMDRELWMRRILGWWLCCIAIKMLLVLTGLVPDEAVLLGHKEYHTLGYSTGNIFHATIAVLVILYLYHRKKRLLFLEVLAILAADYAVYQYSASRGGAAITAAAVVTGYLFKLSARKASMRKMLRGALCIGMVMVFFLSFALPLVYGTGHEGAGLAAALNRALTGRIQWSRMVLLSDPVTLLGNSGIPSAFLDNAYVFLLMKCGSLSAAVICVLYVIAVRSMLRREDDYGIWIVFLFVCYGFVEQLFVNCFLNYSMLLVGHELMNVVLNRKCILGKGNGEKEDGRAEKIAIMYTGYRTGIEKNM